MAQTKLEVMWEVVQSTVIPFIMGRFMGGGHKPPPSATDGGRPEEPLKQQTTSLLKPRNDEAIQMAVDAALGKMPGGMAHIRNVRLVRAELTEDQNTDWRKNLGTHELTERFEHVLASETITRGNSRNQQQGHGAAQPPHGGQERIERKFERRPLDYELTARDPRIKHLILVSKIVTADGVAQTKDYLLQAGLISALSPSEKVAAATKVAEAKTTDAINCFVGNVQPSDAEVLRLATAIESAPNADVRRQREEERRSYFARRAREENVTRKEKNQFATRVFRGFLALVIIIGIVMAANA